MGTTTQQDIITNIRAELDAFTGLAARHHANADIGDTERWERRAEGLAVALAIATGGTPAEELVTSYRKGAAVSRLCGDVATDRVARRDHGLVASAADEIGDKYGNPDA